LFRTKGCVPTCYSPVCRSPPSEDRHRTTDDGSDPSSAARPLSSEGGALDLHVLGLPPAFALSQDQTLKLDENFSRLITTFDEVPLLCARVRSATATCIAFAPAAFHDKGVDLKRRPPKSLPAAPPFADPLLSKFDPRPRTRRAGTPPSTFLFLPIHLSNSPEPRRFQTSGEPESRRSPRLPIHDREPGHRYQ
jgi:hypothetical protein